jgi:hypothetical protein
VLVEYTGPRQGAVAYRGRESRRSYLFDADECLHYVEVRDLELFRLLDEFVVHDECLIDPIREAERARERRLEALERKVAKVAESEAPRPARRGGRPPVSDALGMQAWHLHAHCDWPWQLVADHQGLDGSRPAATVQMRVLRWAERNPERAIATECVICLREDFPPRPD